MNPAKFGMYKQSMASMAENSDGKNINIDQP